MGKFVVVKTIKLDFLGDEWKDCYIKMGSLTIGELTKLASLTDDEAKAGELMISLLKDKFIEGKGWNGEKVVPIKKEDVDDLPIEIFGGIYDQLLNSLPKKK